MGNIHLSYGFLGTRTISVSSNISQFYNRSSSWPCPGIFSSNMASKYEVRVSMRVRNRQLCKKCTTEILLRPGPGCWTKRLERRSEGIWGSLELILCELIRGCGQIVDESKIKRPRPQSNANSNQHNLNCDLAHTNNLQASWYLNVRLRCSNEPYLSTCSSSIRTTYPQLRPGADQKSVEAFNSSNNAVSFVSWFLCNRYLTQSDILAHKSRCCRQAVQTWDRRDRIVSGLVS